MDALFNSSSPLQNLSEVAKSRSFKKSKKRDKVILASKVAGPMRAYLRGGGNNYGLDKMTEAVNDSLKRLQTDYIDLYQLHWPERNTNMFGRLGYEHNDNGEWNKFEDVLWIAKTDIFDIAVNYYFERLLNNQSDWQIEMAKFLTKNNITYRGLFSGNQGAPYRWYDLNEKCRNIEDYESEWLGIKNFL